MDTWRSDVFFSVGEAGRPVPFLTPLHIIETKKYRNREIGTGKKAYILKTDAVLDW